MQAFFAVHSKMKFLDNIQAGHIYLHVGDNVTPSGKGDASPKRNGPNAPIPAAGKFLLHFDFAFLFDWRLLKVREEKLFVTTCYLFLLKI